jgi:hypothetical protein
VQKLGIFRKLFPKKKNKRDETITEIRASINHFTLRSRHFNNKSIESKELAKKFLRQGNGEAAKMSLKRWNRYRIWFNRYQRQITSLEDSIEMIQAAEDTVQMCKAMELGVGELETASKMMSQEKAMETMMKTEALMEDIDRTSEMLSEQMGMEEWDDQVVEREFEKLQSEIAIEEAGELPTIPEREEIVETSKRQKVKKEVEELRKALSEDMKEKE